MKNWRMLAVGLTLVLLPLALGACGAGDTSSTTAPPATDATAVTSTSEGGATSTTASGTVTEAQLQIPEVAVPQSAKKYTLGAAMVAGGEPFQDSVTWAMQEEAKKYGADVVVVDAGGYGNAAKQTSQIEDLVQRKVDAIILWAVSYEGSAPAVDAAAAAGIPVITVVTPSMSKKVSAWVGVDDKEIGQILADNHAKALGGKAKVALINGGEGAAWSKFRADSYTATMKANFPDIQVVEERWTPTLDPATALKLAEDLLLKYPDLTGIYATTTTMAYGVSQAVEAAGRTGKVLLAASAIQGKDDINLLKGGQVAVVTGEPAIITGRWGVDYALKVLAGEQVPPFVKVPTPVYTKDNVGQADFSLELAPQYLK